MLFRSEPGTVDQRLRRAAMRSGSRSFHAAARLLPRSVREPAIALYAFCRDADDAIDCGTGSLDALRERLERIYQDRPCPMPADRGFADIVQRFAIPRALPEALLEGFGWDAEGRRYRDLNALRGYAVRVAGTVGVMMALLMGVRDRARLSAAIELGVAMQLSNIARDVGEDARNGRLYLPLDWLQEAGVDPELFLSQPAHSPALAGVITRLLEEAARHYRRAGIGISHVPWRCRAGISAARLLYAEIGQEVARRGMDAVTARAVVPAYRKVRTVMTGLPFLIVPSRAMPDTSIPEGDFLLDAIAWTQHDVPAKRELVPWWALPARLRWTIELFELMARRESLQS